DYRLLELPGFHPAASGCRHAAESELGEMGQGSPCSSSGNAAELRDVGDVNYSPIGQPVECVCPTWRNAPNGREALPVPAQPIEDEVCNTVRCLNLLEHARECTFLAVRALCDGRAHKGTLAREARSTFCRT